MGDAGFFALFGMIAAVGSSLLVGPIGRAIARRISAEKDPKSGLSTGEMAAERMAQLEQRVHELEERLDFTERMLAQATERPAIGGESAP